MKREDAKDKLFSNLNTFTYTEMNVVGQTDTVFINRSCIVRFIDRIYDENEDEINELKFYKNLANNHLDTVEEFNREANKTIEKLQKEVEYWKLSFNKQVEASRK